MKNKYMPIIKMGDAELRGVEHLEETVKNHVTPIFELTRSRKTAKLKEGSILRRLDKLEKVFGTNRSFILDLTSDPHLTNSEIKSLQNSYRGYVNWCNFVLEQKKRFSYLIPMIQISEDAALSIEENNQNLAKQIRILKQNFPILCYRINILDEVYEEDLKVIAKELGKDKETLMCCMDAVFISKEKCSIFAEEIIKKIFKIYKQFGIKTFSLAGTSFPKNVNQVSISDSASIVLNEVLFAQQIKNACSKETDIDLIYGDYATINQERNDMITTGWIPRIDCPIENLIFYYKKRREGDTYALRYMEVANKIIEDSRFKDLKKKINCWGIEEIEYAAKHRPRGLAPSFWISVRLNIHISLRNFLLNLSKGANFAGQR